MRRDLVSKENKTSNVSYLPRCSIINQSYPAIKPLVVLSSCSLPLPPNFLDLSRYHYEYRSLGQLTNIANQSQTNSVDAEEFNTRILVSKVMGGR